MKTSVFHRILLMTVLLLALSQHLTCQPFVQNLPPESGETIQLFSDRSMYAASENLYFSAFYEINPRIGVQEWSTVLYAELIRWDGTKEVQGKFPIKDGFAEGKLQVPVNIKSGIYYLRAYTRWMRNYSPYYYSYLPIKIINSRIRAIDQGPDSSNEANQNVSAKELHYSENVKFTGLQTTYNCRQEVEFDLSLLSQEISGPYCLSVTKCNDKTHVSNTYSFNPDDEKDSIKVIEFLPEIKNLSLSGKVVSKSDHKALSKEKIILSSTIDPLYFSTVTTDNDGAFFFLIPEYYGSHQFCLTTENDDLNDVQFLVGNEYCDKTVNLPYSQFELSSDEAELAREMTIYSQLENKYTKDESNADVMKSEAPFYGQAQEIIFVKDFIELNNLEEIFFELVMNVLVRHTRDEVFITLLESGSWSRFPPLVLFDNIPVANDKSLLSISSKEIERIEVINGGYIIGKNMYSGIISIYSTKYDLAGMKLRKNIQFFDLQLFGESDHTFPIYSQPNDDKDADLRRLLYWKPFMEISSEEATKISFYTSDDTGKYTVLIRGISEDGKSLLYGEKEFIVVDDMEP
ncbi:MAG: hypothetical protein PF450_13250 [Bacteroidales bacterium]|jgi:hypothetical protein|nr:hypothetical protein [Bacteroidales bacterium]